MTTAKQQPHLTQRNQATPQLVGAKQAWCADRRAKRKTVVNSIAHSRQRAQAAAKRLRVVRGGVLHLALLLSEQMCQ